jgi:hypothetical protein
VPRAERGRSIDGQPSRHRKSRGAIPASWIAAASSRPT